MGRNLTAIRLIGSQESFITLVNSTGPALITPTFTVKANTMNDGCVVKGEARGNFKTKATGDVDFFVRVRLNGLTPFLVNFRPSNSTVFRHWKLEFGFVVQKLGRDPLSPPSSIPLAQLYAWQDFTWTRRDSPITEAGGPTHTTAIGNDIFNPAVTQARGTNDDLTIDVEAGWDVADPDNEIICRSSYITIFGGG